MLSTDAAEKFNLLDRGRQYHQRFSGYTAEEPCRWAEFYLKRSAALLSDGDEIRAEEVSALIDKVQALQLLSAKPTLERLTVECA